jgi:O-antigen/teichoic acid export membrane protein
VDVPATGERPADVLDTSGAGPAAIRGGVVRLAGYAIGVLLSVGSTALLFRHLGVVRSGQYVTVVSLIGVAQGLTDVGLSALGVREMSVRDAAGRRVLMQTLLGLRIVMTLLGVGVAVVFAAAAGYEPEMVVGTALAGAGLLVQNLQGTLAIDLTSRLRFLALTAAELVRQVVMVALIVALVVVGAGLVPFLAATIAAGAAALAVTVVMVRTDAVPLRPSFRWAEWRELVRETLPFAVATAVYALYFRVAIIIVSLIADERDIGYFGAAFRIVEVLLLVPALAIGAAFPIFARAARDDLDRLRYGVARTFETALLFGAWIALALALGAPLAIRIVAGEEFAPAVPLLRIEAVALGAAFVSQTFGYALLSLRRHRELLAVSLGALAVTTAATALLTEADGVRGAAIAVALGEVALALGNGLALHRALPEAGVPLGALWRVGAAAGAGAGAALLADGPALLQASVCTAVFFVVAIGVRAVPAELLAELRRRSR